MDDDHLLSVAEVARMLGRSPDYVRRAAAAGVIPGGIRMPGRGSGQRTTWRFVPSAIEAWISDHRSRP